MKKDAKQARLTTVSAMYDLDGDGILDDTEKAMRQRDASNRGYLTNDEIYEIVADQLSAQKDAHRYKKAIAGLICFIFILALSNLGTSFASVILAKEVTADSDAGTMTNVATGEIMSVQTAGDTFDLQEMDDEVYEERRQLVLSLLEEDPHHTSHAHRRLAKKCKNNNSLCDGKIVFDDNFMPESQFRQLQNKCEQKKTVNVRRRFDDGFEKSDCLCNGDSSVVVKTKKVKVTGVKGPKKKKNQNDREVTIVTGTRTCNWDCDGDYCYGSGTLLLAEEGETCNIRKNNCVDDLLCIGKANSRTGICSPPVVLKLKTQSTITQRYVQGGKKCNVAYGRDACTGKYYCYAADAFVGTGKCELTSEVRTVSVSIGKDQRVGDQCNVSFGNRACKSGNYCSVSSTFATTGICVEDVRVIVDTRSIGSVCDTSFGSASCGSGLYCMVTNNEVVGVKGVAGANGVVDNLQGSSGSITYGSGGGVIQGPSGTIYYGNALPVIRTTGVCVTSP